MASPLGHSVLGLTIALASSPASSRKIWRLGVFCIFGANSADLDFVPGLFIGDINRYHQTVSHSLFAAALFGVMSAWLAPYLGETRLRVGTMGFSAYASHLFLDFLVVDERPPLGIPMFWPFMSDHFIAPWPLLMGIRHGVPGDDLIEFARQFLSLHNLIALGLEFILLLPALTIAVMFCRGALPWPQGHAGTPTN